MTLSTQPYKGARDFYPEDKRIQKYMFGIMRQVVERYGYEEYDAPILEPLELYVAKTSEEIVSQQTYAFEDRGGRKVVIRPEMTPTVSRMVAAKRQELAYPLRWYSIPNLWRYERPQRGRLREHWQLNVDIFGTAGLHADVEMIQIADSIMKAFGAQQDMYEIRVNSRKLLNRKVEEAGVNTSVNDVIRLIDTFEKLDRSEFEQRLAEQVDEPSKLMDFLTSGGESQELDGLVQAADDLSIAVKPVPSLARGFDYYTDIIFEVFDKHPDNNRSMFGGGRYDGLVGQFGVEPVPTVGFGMGDVALANFLESHNLLPKLAVETDIYVILAGDIAEQASGVIAELRRQLNVAVDFSGRKLGHMIKTADKKGIPFVLVVGESELSEQKYSLKQLASGEQQQLALEEIINTVKNRASN